MIFGFAVLTLGTAIANTRSGAPPDCAHVSVAVECR